MEQLELKLKQLFIQTTNAKPVAVFCGEMRQDALDCFNKVCFAG